MAERKKLARIKGTDFVGEVVAWRPISDRFLRVQFPGHGSTYSAFMPADMVEVFDEPPKSVTVASILNFNKLRADEDGPNHIFLTGTGLERQTWGGRFKRTELRALRDWLNKVLDP